VAGAGHVDHVEVSLADHPVEVGVEEVQPRSRPPVAEQARLDVLGYERIDEQGVGEQVDLPDREVVRRSPVRVQAAQLFGRQRGVVDDFHPRSIARRG
jgi:hypothetical protein